MSLDKISVDKMSVDKMSVDKMTYCLLKIFQVLDTERLEAVS